MQRAPAHIDGGDAGARGDRDLLAHLPQLLDDAVHEQRLADAGAPRDEDVAPRERHFERALLLCAQLRLLLALDCLALAVHGDSVGSRRHIRIHQRRGHAAHEARLPQHLVRIGRAHSRTLVFLAPRLHVRVLRALLGELALEHPIHAPGVRGSVLPPLCTATAAPHDHILSLVVVREHGARVDRLLDLPPRRGERAHRRLHVCTLGRETARTGRRRRCHARPSAEARAHRAAAFAAARPREGRPPSAARAAACGSSPTAPHPTHPQDRASAPIRAFFEARVRNSNENAPAESILRAQTNPYYRSRGGGGGGRGGAPKQHASIDVGHELEGETERRA